MPSNSVWSPDNMGVQDSANSDKLPTKLNAFTDVVFYLLHFDYTFGKI